MTYAMSIIAFVLVAAAFAHLWVDVLGRFRGTKRVLCPETHEDAAVTMEAAHAAWTFLRGRTELRLSKCSRRPDRTECGQGCLQQLESSLEGYAAPRAVRHS